MKFKNFNSGFTLIELMVVAGILAILLSIAVIAINPMEQFAKANDLTRQAAVQDTVNASNIYFAENRVYPWDKNSQCLAEIEKGGVFSTMEACISEITGRSNDQLTSNEVDKFSNIHVNKCKDHAVMCYLPSSKKIINESEAKFDKFGVVKPGCPNDSDETECYWCRPVNQNETCTGPPISPAPTPTETPEQLACTRADVPGYKIDDTKLFRTAGVFLFEHPGFPTDRAGGWPIQFSLRPDFGGDYTETINSIDRGTDIEDNYPNHFAWDPKREISNGKYSGFYSIANHSIYTNNCGRTVYWRPTANRYDENNNYLYTDYGPTNTSVIDCETIVGVISPPISWYSVYDYSTQSQKEYMEEWDFDCSGEIDWTDYWLGAFSRKFRSGGWQPPE